MKKVLFFLRHPAPKIPPGYCYGSTDLEIAEPEKLSRCHSEFELIFSSPLQRCSKAAQILFPKNEIIIDERLKELNFGEWENRKWDDIPRSEIDRWGDDILNVRPGGAENFLELSERVNAFLKELLGRKEEKILVLSHAGTMRAALSYIMNISLEKTLNFTLGYFHCAEYAFAEPKSRLLFWNLDFHSFLKEKH